VEACRGTTHAVNTDFIAILQTIPVFVFAFTCHQNAFIVYNGTLPAPYIHPDVSVALISDSHAAETQDPRPRRTVRFVAIPAVLTTLVSYLVVGLMGYFMYGDNIQSNILSKNYPQNSIPVAVARIV
jgi:amino acid permease